MEPQRLATVLMLHATMRIYWPSPVSVDFNKQKRLWLLYEIASGMVIQRSDFHRKHQLQVLFIASVGWQELAHTEPRLLFEDSPWTFMTGTIETNPEWCWTSPFSPFAFRHCHDEFPFETWKCFEAAKVAANYSISDATWCLTTQI